ncbi:ANTAR domain-containing protein [Friedmanniella luteola]|uniref:ANTAR domain-containing protein n=1 Tax=Friedmanniella luteola TaxID=546871 RepID=A0A1H1ZES7_9ACTN|nr:ANTAR domain-containing protein [Friedmanniella luteola]SDT32295.1 ANTAR domain-containing protein [Friedmanniella luteola]
MDDDAFRHQVWTRLERSVVETTSVQDYLQDAVLATEAVVGVEGSFSLSVLLYGNLLTVATTDRSAWDADQVEFDTEAGPCVEALRNGVDTGVVDLRTEQRWPAWAAVSTLLGFHGAAGIPAEITPGQRLALNLYTPDPEALHGEPVHRARLFNQEVARTLPTVLRITEQGQLAEHLQEALAGRSTIDQALGVLMAQNRCTRDEAFGILRRASQHRNLKLREVAAAVIERFTGHAAAEPPPFTPPRPARDRPVR